MIRSIGSVIGLEAPRVQIEEVKKRMEDFREISARTGRVLEPYLAHTSTRSRLTAVTLTGTEPS